MATMTKTKPPTIIASGDPLAVKQFTYRARNSAGKVVPGAAKALAKADVTRELLRQGLTPLSIKGGGVTGVGLSTEIKLRKTAKKRDLVITTRMLAAMFDSGLSYIESLDIVREDCPDPLLASGLNEVRIAVANGSSLSEALAAQGDVFPPMMINLITSGEAGGKVKEAMNRVADQLDAEDRLRAKIKKAMMYPMVVMAISSLVFGFMMLYLVPQFSKTFKDLGGPDTQLPKLTQMVVGVSSLMQVALPIAAVLIIPGMLWYRHVKNRERVREVVDPLKLKMPIFGNLFHMIALARFTRNLSGLLDAGVERLEALEITAKTCGNIMMERAVMAARDAQRQGRPLVTPLRAEPLFPNLVTKMVEVGERSGRTGFMLSKAADIYDRDVDQITDNMSALIEPLFLVIMGLMVGVLVIAIYLPYLSIGDVIDGPQ